MNESQRIARSLTIMAIVIGGGFTICIARAIIALTLGI